MRNAECGVQRPFFTFPLFPFSLFPFSLFPFPFCLLSFSPFPVLNKTPDRCK